MKVVQAADWLAMRLSSGAGGRAGTPKTADEPSKHAMAFAACSSPTSCLTRLRCPQHALRMHRRFARYTNGYSRRGLRYGQRCFVLQKGNKRCSSRSSRGTTTPAPNGHPDRCALRFRKRVRRTRMRARSGPLPVALWLLVAPVCLEPSPCLPAADRPPWIDCHDRLRSQRLLRRPTLPPPPRAASREGERR